MTISTSSGRIQYTGNGSTTAFPTNFKLLDSAHVKVILTDATGTTNTVQVETTNYTVTGVGSNPSTVVMTSAPATGEVVTLVLDVPLTQDTDLINGQSFDADIVETSLDLGVQVDQGLSEKFTRTLQVPETVITSFDGALPAITPDYILTVNAAGNGFIAKSAFDAGLSGGSLEALTALDVAGDITVSGTVDGVDVSDLKADVDGFPDELKTLTPTEINNIGTTNIVGDASPQLGGSLDVNGQTITSAAAGNIAITPDTTGDIVLDGQKWPQADGTVNQSLQTDGAGQTSWSDSNTIISPAATDITLTPGTTGNVIIDGLKHPQADGTVGQVLRTDGAGQLSFLTIATGGLGNVVEDVTPQLGGSLDVNGQTITSTAGADISITPDTTGNVIIDGLKHPQADGTIGQVLQTDGAGQLSFLTITTGGLGNVLEDTTPQLGGQLDVNGQAIGDGTNELITFTEDALAVNQINIENEATGSGPIISASGDDTNIDLVINPKGTGALVLDGLNWPTADGTTGQLIKTDGAGGLSFVAAPTGDVTPSSTDTFTNKTIDANGTGNSISNIDIADLANGTDGELITWDAAGAPAVVATGTATHVLTSNGAGTAPTFQAAGGGGGAWSLISSATASADATIEFTGLTSAYAQYKLIISDAIPATDIQGPRVRISTDGGSTWKSDATYNSAGVVSLPTPTLLSNVDKTYWSLSKGSNPAGNASGEAFAGEVTLHSPGVSKYPLATISSTSTDYLNSLAGLFFQANYKGGTAAVDAIQFYFASGNIASGEFRLYGLSLT